MRVCDVVAVQVNTELRKGVIMDSPASLSYDVFIDNSDQPMIMKAYVYGVLCCFRALMCCVLVCVQIF